VGFEQGGAWRVFKLRQDFIAAEKVQMEDDISASVVVPAERLPNRSPDNSEPCVKLVVNCEKRLFQRPGQGPGTASVLLLLDLSASTLDPAPGSAQTLLALEQQAALLLARSALAGGDRIAIHGFSSDTRARVDYFRLLDFGAPLDAPASARIAGVGAAHSTRMGAALRHAAGLLAAEDAAQRAIVVITDGAPSDVDVFDRHYLVEDAQAAVRQARQRGVQTRCLAVDPAADAYVRRIFGWRNYRIVASAAQLPGQLVDLYARLTPG